MRLYFGVIICLALCAWSVVGYGEEEGELDFDLIHHKPFKWVNAKLKETVLARLDTIENSTMRSEVKPFFGAWFSVGTSCISPSRVPTPTFTLFATEQQDLEKDS